MIIEGLRSRRNEMLSECDWTQLPDSPLTSDQKSVWAAYRQLLRDFPATNPDLDNPAWPGKPE